MMYLIDTDWIINVLKNKGDYGKRIKEFAKDGLAISSISAAEVLTGIVEEPQEEKVNEIYYKFLALTTEIPFDSRVTLIFAKIRKDLLHRHIPLENFDIAIAATAIAYNLTLLTDNVTHYKRIKELKFYTS